MDDGLDPWVVLYRMHPADPLHAFCCRAVDGDDADEQCRKAYPACHIAWTALGDLEDAIRDFQKHVEV